MTYKNSAVKIINSPFGESYWPSWLRWCPTSLAYLEAAESRIFAHITNKIDFSFVAIKNSTLYLRSMIASKFGPTENKEYHEKIPIVMIHGMGAGIGLWCKNVDPISNCRKFYAMDVLGFGYSSRPTFSNDPSMVEDVYVESFEEWRQNMGLDKFILLGHSMGGYLAYAYAMRYPQNVRHLILADPWGFSKYQDNEATMKINIVLKGFLQIMNILNPLALVRVAGPLGPRLIRTARPDLGHYFKSENSEPNMHLDVFEYIYHCNAQYPSGEMAFKTLSYKFGWARNPMIERVSVLDKSVPITFIYGEESWMDMSVARQFQDQRPESYVDVQMILGVGHHIYVEDSDDFNQKVNRVCDIVDNCADTLPITDTSDRKQRVQRRRGRPFRPNTKSEQAQNDK